VTPSEILAANNAFLNASSGVCLALAVGAIRRGDRPLHRKLMLGALSCSALFLTSYLVRVALYPSRPFPGHGAVRAVYFTLLLSHMLLAMAVPPLALRTLWLAEFKQRFEEHRRLARITFPVWMYVSVTGVLVYAMLFHWPA
jgi:putative membrane protein